MNIGKTIWKVLKSNKDERRILKYKLINRIASKNGWKLHSPRYSAWKNEEYLKVIEKGGYPFNDKKYMIYQLAKGVSNLQGHTAECGVFKGHGSWLILHAGDNPEFEHHIFDSFEGVSEPDKMDNVGDPKSYQWKKHDMSYPLDSVKEKFQGIPNVYYHKAWIPEKFPEVENLRFRFVHVDVDLYQPTFDSFKFFYSRMVQGGIMLCDDYACPGTPGALKAVDEFLADKPEKVVITVPGSGFIVKQ